MPDTEKSITITIFTVYKTVLLLYVFTIYYSFSSYGHSEINNSSNDCNLTNNENYKSTKLIESVFGELDNQMTKAVKENKIMNTVIFIGITGAGKSTLVHLLSGNNTNLEAKEIVPDLGQYIITGSKISNETITSKTLYPELIIDNKAGVVLCDSPGFDDTRNEILEIIAASTMVTILERSQNIKIVLVVPHSSIKKGMYRSDFMNLLGYTITLITDTDKYRNSIYLVATKADNEYSYRNGNLDKISDEAMIQGIHSFLKETKMSVENEIIQGRYAGTVLSENHLGASVKLIDALLADSNGTDCKISIFRRPEEGGPLSSIKSIQDDRRVLRENLLSDRNFAESSNTEFGYAISDSAKMYINKLFTHANSYIFDLSQLTSQHFLSQYENKLLKLDLQSRLQELRTIKTDVTELIDNIEKSGSPKNFIEVLEHFSLNKNIQNKCSAQLKNLTIIDKYLIRLEKLSNATIYNQNRWQTPFQDLIIIINNDIENCNLINDVFNTLTSYEVQRNRTDYYIPLIAEWEKENEDKNVSEQNFDKFLNEFISGNRYIDVKLNSYAKTVLNRAIDITIKSKLDIKCVHDETLIVEGYIVLTSEINHGYLQRCRHFKSLIILAKHTVFIDENLDNDMFKGNQIAIIAPTWKIQGTRTINVNGKPGSINGLNVKADLGSVGENGQSGGKGGSFKGVGMTFENAYNLLITATGGSGQDGQDGGDGWNGADGVNGGEFYGFNSNTKTDKAIYIVVNTYTTTTLRIGQHGSSGGNSGAGGFGGEGGKGGLISVTNVGSKSHGLQLHAYNGLNGKNGKAGKPGRGGYGGCDKVEIKSQNYLFFLYSGENRNHYYTNCRLRADDGDITRNHNNFLPVFNDTPPKKIDIDNYLVHYERDYYSKYSSKLYDGTFHKFLQKIRERPYTY